MPEGLKDAMDRDIKTKILNQFSFLKLIFSNLVI